MLGFERLSVLVVDDNPVIRSIVPAMFQTLGARQIFTANDGMEAIDFIKRVDASPTEAGVAQLDLIVADLIMPRLDGFTLLRWLRNAPASPDRYVAAIAVSGATHPDRVARVRDMGATEIVAKPFTFENLANRVLHIINQPRQFVLAPGYFGPDRRRHAVPVAVDRRVMPAEGIQVINAGDGTKRIRPGADVVFIRLRNRLKEKIASGQDIPPLDDAILLAIAESIQKYVGSYSNWMGEQIDALRATLGQLLGGGRRQAEHLDRMHRLTMELRSQGELFGYPLVTEFSNSLYDLTYGVHPEPLARRYLDLVQAHVQGISAVLNEDITGDGGSLGREVRAALERARTKFGRSPADAASPSH